NLVDIRFLFAHYRKGSSFGEQRPEFFLLNRPMRVRDPVHGFIHLSDREVRLIECAAFRRLRNIKQLALTYLVYPGAMHTRFEHSLGVMELASKAFEAIQIEPTSKKLLINT